MNAHRCDVLTGELDSARVRSQLARELVDERSLACAVGADDGVQFALTDIDRHRVGHQQRAVALGDGMCFQQCVHLGDSSAEPLLTKRSATAFSHPVIPRFPNIAINKTTMPKTAIQCSV
jgi:hypothetical protein